MSESSESSGPARTRRAMVEDPRVRRWLLLIAVVAAVVIVAEAVIFGGYDGLAALVGILFGAALGRIISALDWIYSTGWHFWVIVGLALVVWIANIVTGLFVFYPMWIYGFLFFFPMVFAGYVFFYGMLRE